MGVITPSGCPWRLYTSFYVDLRQGMQTCLVLACVCESMSDLCSLLGAKDCVSMSTGIRVAQNLSMLLHLYLFIVRCFSATPSLVFLIRGT